MLQLLDLLETAALLLRALGRDVGAREAEQVLEVRAELAREAAHGAVGPVGRVLVGAQVVQDEEAHRVLERRLGREEAEAPVELVEHARPDLGVAEEVDLAVGRDRARLHLPDVVEERGPADLEPRHRLPHDLLRVLPDVLVAPLAVAEADHRVHLGEDGRERAHLEQLVEAALGVVSHDDAVEAIAHRTRVELHRGAEVVDARRAPQGGPAGGPRPRRRPPRAHRIRPAAARRG